MESEEDLRRVTKVRTSIPRRVSEKMTTLVRRRNQSQHHRQRSMDMKAPLSPQSEESVARVSASDDGLKKYEVDYDYLFRLFQMCSNVKPGIDADIADSGDDCDDKIGAAGASKSPRSWKTGCHNSSTSSLMSCLAEKDLVISELQMEMQIAEMPNPGVLRYSPRKRSLTDVEQYAGEEIILFAKDLVRSVAVVPV